MSNFHKIILGLTVLCGALWLSDQELKDEIREQQNYCDMLKAEAWPDFRPEVNCKITEDFFND